MAKKYSEGNDNDKNTTSLDSFESVIASIVPQIVSEQVSKMRIAEKEQYTLLEKKHKSMLLQSRQARKQLEGTTPSYCERSMMRIAIACSNGRN